MTTTLKQVPPESVAHFYQTTFAPIELAGCKIITRHQYATSVWKFVEFSGGHTPIADLTPDRVEAFYRYVRATCGSILTAGKYRRQLRRILYAYRPETPRPVHPPNKIIETDAPEGSLWWFWESRYLPERRVSPAYLAKSSTHLRQFGRWLGRPAMLTDLTAETINPYLKERLRSHSTYTVRSDLTLFKALWRAAYDWGLLDALPRRLFRLRCDPIIPAAWDMGELQRLIAACSHRDMDHFDQTGRVHIGRFFEALIRAAHDTALRLGDLTTITRDQLRADGVLVLLQAKTGGVKACRLRPATMAAIARAAVAGDSRLLPWPIRHERIYKHFRELLVVAGLPGGRRNGIQKLRRTSATMLEAECPGSATWHLGHRSADLARRHYLDPRFAAPPRLPPAIPEPPKLLEGPGREDVA